MDPARKMAEMRGECCCCTVKMIDASSSCLWSPGVAHVGNGKRRMQLKGWLMCSAGSLMLPLKLNPNLGGWAELVGYPPPKPAHRQHHCT